MRFSQGKGPSFRLEKKRAASNATFSCGRTRDLGALAHGQRCRARCRRLCSRASGWGNPPARCRSAKDKGDWYAVLDRQPQKRYDAIGPDNTRVGFTPDGGLCNAFVGRPFQADYTLATFIGSRRTGQAGKPDLRNALQSRPGPSPAPCCAPPSVDVPSRDEADKPFFHFSLPLCDLCPLEVVRLPDPAQGVCESGPALCGGAPCRGR